VRLLILIALIFLSNNSFGQEIKGEFFTIVEDMPLYTEACKDFPKEINRIDCSRDAINDYLNLIPNKSDFLTKEEKPNFNIHFIVEKDGSISNATIDYSFENANLDSAFLSYLQKMPKFFEAGMQRKTPVRVQLKTAITLSAENISEKQEDVFYTIVEEMPIFNKKCISRKDSKERTKCSHKAMHKYIEKVKYPSVYIDSDVSGKVYIRFIVNTDGSVTNVSLARGTNTALDKAALEHIKNMPDFFKPGYQSRKAVRVQYIVPVKFNL